jgi:ornithine cyclodeaminase/alanine dehydrogenase-like protein (mu-crystallin family)
LTEKGKSAVACQSTEECVKDADVIVTATFASSPIISESGSNLEPTLMVCESKYIF